MKMLGRGGGLVHTFYSDDPSSNSAGYLNFMCEKAKINKKEAGISSSLKKKICKSLSKSSVYIDGQVLP